MARLGVLAVVLAACTHSVALPSAAPPSRKEPTAPPIVASPPRGVSRAPTPAESAVIRDLMTTTEQLRGLSFRAPVTVRIQDKLAVRTYVKEALDEAELRRARRRYVALGLLDPQLDVRELIESLMEEELIGYYDPKAKVLAVREEVASSLARNHDSAEDEQWKATVVHELVHALQDQQLGLSAAMQHQRTTDAENAFGAIVEGDATLAMLGYMAARQGSSLDAVVSAPDQLAIALRSGSAKPGGKLAHAPALLREPLLFRYRDGALFAAKLYARGGWSQVDDAHRKRPTSTAAIREPSKYLDGPDEAALPAPPDLHEHGCTQVDDDVLGSLELATAIADEPPLAYAIARSWRADRYLVLRCADRDASVWVLRFHSPNAAQRARKAFERLSGELQQPRRVLDAGVYLLVALDTPAEAAAALAGALRDLAATP